MTPKKFNQLSLDKKFTWIMQRLNGQPTGFCNKTLFKDKIIRFIFDRNGQPSSADAEAVPKEDKKVIAETLDRLKLVCVNRDCDNDPDYRQKLFEEKFNNSSLKN